LEKVTKDWSFFSKALKISFFLSVVLCIALIPTLKKMNTEYSVDQFLPDKHPLLEARAQLNDDFSLASNSPILILVQYENQSWLTKDKMDQLRRVTKEISEMKDVESVQSLANIESAAEEGSEIAMGGLLELTNPEGWKARVTEDPILFPLLISKELDTAVIAIQSLKARSEMMNLIEELRAKVSKEFQGAKIQLGGVPTIQAQMAKLIGNELKLFLLLALLVACFSLFFVFSNIMSILTPVVAVLLSVLLSVEFMVAANLSFNALSATVMVLVTVIVVAMCIHTQLRFCKEYKELKNKTEAMKTTFYSLFLPNFLTALTTAVGFITLYFSPAPLMREYGLSVSVAVFIAWFVTSLFLFGFLDRMPTPKARPWVFGQAKVLPRLLKMSPIIIVGIICFSIACLLLSRNLSWEARLFDDLPHHHEANQVSRLIDSELGGLISFNVSLSSEEEGYWNEPEALRKLDELEKSWRKMDFVESVISVPELIRQSKNNPQMAIPNERSKIAEIGFIFSLAEKNPLIHFLTPDGSSLRVAFRVSDQRASATKAVVEKIKSDVIRVFPNLKMQSGGMASYAHELSRYLSEQIMIGFWWAMLAICLVLLFVFRSLGWTLLATLPNFLPAIGLLGLLGLTEIPVKPAIATIFSIALGIAFDNTVYILSRLKSYKSPIGQKLVERAIQEEGISCFISSFCLFCGFAIFLMSYFSINQYFGMFLLFSILVGLVGDLLFLPSILCNLPEAIKKRLKV
jgi:hypothetical protein